MGSWLEVARTITGVTALTPFPIWWTITRKLGFTGYLVAAVFCFVVWLRARSEAGRSGAGSHSLDRAALAIAAFEGAFCLDMIFEWRLKLHTLCASFLAEHQLYAGRRPIQMFLLAALGCVLLLTANGVIRRFHPNRGRLVALFGVGISLTLYLIEIISMHETDAILYHETSNVMAIAYVWLAACSLTVAGVWIEAHSPSVKRN